MYKGTRVHGITIKRLSALEVIVFGLSNAFFLQNFFGSTKRSHCSPNLVLKGYDRCYNVGH